MQPAGRRFEAVRKAHRLDVALFGTMGAIAAEICSEVSTDFVGKQFDFMDVTKFARIGDPRELNRVYWSEMLFRVSWAAGLNLMRHQRWQGGCIDAFEGPGNFLSFSASLRGLLEASLDASYSLRSVVPTLARDRTMIESALRGRLHPRVVVNKELEELLIHFVYARKVGTSEKTVVATSHAALEPKDYRNAIGLPESEREAFRGLYDQLCAVCHPTAHSLTFLWRQSEEGDSTLVQVGQGGDKEMIEYICREYAETISLALSLSVTTSAVCLKALNRFPLPEVRCPSVEGWNFDDVPLWSKHQSALSSGVLH